MTEIRTDPQKSAGKALSNIDFEFRISTSEGAFEAISLWRKSVEGSTLIWTYLNQLHLAPDVEADEVCWLWSHPSLVDWDVREDLREEVQYLTKPVS